MNECHAAHSVIVLPQAFVDGRAPRRAVRPTPHGRLQVATVKALNDLLLTTLYEKPEK